MAMYFKLQLSICTESPSLRNAERWTTGTAITISDPEADQRMTKPRVYYNGACRVCKAGIRKQRQMLDAANAEIAWIDVADDNGIVQEIDADLDFVRERLHVVDRNGQVRIGSDAFVTLWKIMPGQKLLGKISGLPVVRTLFRWSYNGFAALLYRWNKLNHRW